jgi:hypothetical protein
MRVDCFGYEGRKAEEQKAQESKMGKRKKQLQLLTERTGAFSPPLSPNFLSSHLLSFSLEGLILFLLGGWRRRGGIQFLCAGCGMLVCSMGFFLSFSLKRSLTICDVFIF